MTLCANGASLRTRELMLSASIDSAMPPISEMRRRRSSSSVSNAFRMCSVTVFNPSLVDGVYPNRPVM